jgi:hypothetical protein
MATHVPVGRSKNLRDLRVEKEGHVLLLRDPRFQQLDTRTKNEILRHLGIGPGEGYGPRSFDLVMTDKPVEAITSDTIPELVDKIRLVELKTTKKAIRDENLGGFFYGATENEYRLAARLGDRFLFAFVVLNSQNRFGRPFAALRTLEQIEAQTKSKRTQFQVTLREGAITDDQGRLVFIEIDEPPESSPDAG